MPTAITRDINSDFGNCELTYLPRVPIDVDLARQQHEQYQSALASLGCEIVAVPTEPGLADSVFIEDTAMVLDEIAVMLRPGAQSRRPEVAGVEAVLEQYRTLATIGSPGTLDGGDLLCVGKTVFAGLSTRSNREGIDQLQDVVKAFGYSVVTVETAKCLHLTSAVTQVSPGTLLINPDWIDAAVFADYDLIDVDEREPHAANALLAGTGLIYPESFPRTLGRLVACGIEPITVDLSELQKAEGAATCCSLIVTTP
jgi:dimethylargininase